MSSILGLKKGDKDPINKYLNWKIPFTLGIISMIIVYLLLINGKDLLEERFNILFFSRLYGFFVTMILVNMGMATYTLSLYYYRISKIGMKGNRGSPGKRGKPGKQSYCSINQKVTSTFSLEKDVEEKDYNVELNLPETINIDETEDLGWTPILETEEYTGYNSEECLKDEKCTKDTSTYNKSKPFNGAIVDYNNKTGDIYSIQYTYDNSDIPLKNKTNTRLSDKRFGSKENLGTINSFKCPPHSAIYKVEALYSDDRKKTVDNNTTTSEKKYGGVKGIKFHCRDIKTGKKAQLLDNKNNTVDSIFYGINPKQNNSKYKYVSSSCKYNEEDGVKSPGFLSKVEILHTKDTEDNGASKPGKINGIKFEQCSYYRDPKV